MRHKLLVEPLAPALTQYEAWTLPQLSLVNIAQHD
jgi:hypothetical protein